MLQQNFTEHNPAAAPFDMIFVPGGAFDMGGSDPEAISFEKPVHRVHIPGFFIGKFPVTQALWKAVLAGDDPSNFKGDNRPVEQVSWEDVTQKFLPALRKMSGKPYRLPTEAEWEFAARGGPFSEKYLYAGSDKLSEVGWFHENSGSETQDVGLLYPNELGIFDMSGNVWEWVEDDWHDNFKDNPPTDGSAWVGKERGALRVDRGGSWRSLARNCRASYRNHDRPGLQSSFLGFRLALPFQGGG